MKSLSKAVAAGLAILCAAALGWHFALRPLLTKTAEWDSVATVRWGRAFQRVDIPRGDGSKQPAFFLPAPAGTPKPLVVSLHTWSSGYAQGDPISALAKERGWNYVHPDFGGPNNTPDACLSPRALSDIDAAIQYGIDHGNTDPANVFVVGVSGGGYAALASYLTTRQPVKAVQAWASISDLSAWYRQSIPHQRGYAEHILACTASVGALNEQAARARSPLYMAPAPGRRPVLEIYAGVHDGHDGSVSILHSIKFFNRVATENGRAESAVTAEEALRLLSRDVVYSKDQIGNRSVVLERRATGVRLVVFDGHHEMLPEYAMSHLADLAGDGPHSSDKD